MTQFRTSAQILSSVWVFETVDMDVPLNPDYWEQSRPISFDDVKIWEEIEFVPGCFGIYVSWDPYTEFYAVVFNQFLDSPAGVQIFSGDGAAQEVKLLAEKLGYNLVINKILINK